MKAPLARQLTGLILALGLLLNSIAPSILTSWPSVPSKVVKQPRTAQQTKQSNPQSAHPDSMAQTKGKASEAYGKLPISFEVNRGQTDEAVKFLARGSGYNLFLTATEAVLSLRKESPRVKSESLMAKAGRGRKSALLSHASSTTSTLRMKLAGANPEAQAKGEEKLPGTINYFTGRDAGKWQTQISSYAKVRYQNVYPGVDMVYYGNQRELEYDFVVAPGANPDAIKLTFAGAQKMSVADSGDLVLQTDTGNLLQRKPVTYQETNGSRQAVVARYVIRDGQVGFEVGDYDRNKPLIIDPILSYSTYLGGSGDYEAGFSVAVDANGNAYVVGTTTSTDYPVTPGAVQTTVGDNNALGDAFVAKLNAAGTSLVYSTYLGGDANDYAYDIALDADGNAYVMGSTVSSDFPTTSGAFQVTNASSNGSEDGFITKLNATGSSILYSTYLGGSGSDSCRAIAINSLGEAYVTGGTQSVDFPTTTGAYQTTSGSLNGNSDAFVTKLNATGTALAFSTFIGGSSATGQDLALDSNGNVYFVGDTYAGTLGGGQTIFAYPVTPNAYQSAPAADGFEGIVSELSADGTQLLYSSYLGGSMEESAIGVAVDASDNVYVAGYTGSADFPVTSGCAQPVFGGPYDTFISKFNLSSPSAISLIYSTYLGGSNLEDPYGIVVDSTGNAYVAGYTASYDFPVTQTSSHGWLSAFVTKLNAAGSQFLDSTRFGEVYTYGYGLAIDSAGNAYVVGETTSDNFPTTPGSLQTTFGGGSSDGFVTKVDFVTRHAELAINLSASPETVAPNSSLTYNIGVSNNGPHQANSVTLTDELPAGVSFVSASSTQGSCTAAGSTVTCELGDLNQSSNVSITIIVNVTAASGTTLVNNASVSSTTTDANTQDNSATVNTEVYTFADMSVYAMADPYYVLSGTNVTYTVDVTNNGPSAATSVTLTGTLSPDVALSTIVNNYGSCTSAPESGGGTHFDCTLGDFDPSVSKAITFTGNATGAPYTPLPLVATVGSTMPDLYTSNNNVYVEAYIFPPPEPTPTPTPCTNVAAASYGATASASSEAGVGYPASGVIDGNRAASNWGSATGWNDSTAGSFPDNVVINLGVSQALSEIDVYSIQDNYGSPIEPTDTMTFIYYGLTDFQVQVPDGAGGWVDVPGGHVTGNNLVKRKVIFDSPVVTDQIRVSVNSSADGVYSRIAEVEAFSCSAEPGPTPTPTPTPTPAPCTTNVAASSYIATASASSTISSNYPASGAIDGNHVGNGWGTGVGWNDATDGVYPDSLTINLNISQDLSEIDVYSLQDNYGSPVEPTNTMTFTQYGLVDFQVQIPDGLGGWEDVPGGNITGNNLVKRRVIFDSPVTTDQIRILVNNSADGVYTRIVEVEAFSCTPQMMAKPTLRSGLSRGGASWWQQPLLVSMKRH